MVKFFRLTMPENMLTDRQMKKDQHKAIMRFLRQTTRYLHSMIDEEILRKSITKAVIYGQQTINVEDLLRNGKT